MRLPSARWRFSVSTGVNSELHVQIAAATSGRAEMRRSAGRVPRLVTLSVVGFGLVVTGFMLRQMPAVGERGMGPQIGLGLLGGFRALAADLAWLRTYVSWETRNAPATEMLIELTTTLDPRPLCFWLNGARMTAYDLPEWRIAAGGGYLAMSQEAQVRIRSDHAERALALLDSARTHHPSSAAIWIERANIELNRLNDPAAAAESYRRASTQPDAPYYAARLHAELLRRLGRKADALAWLVALHPRLPADHEAAAATLVLARIRELERELAIPPERRYRASGP